MNRARSRTYSEDESGEERTSDLDQPARKEEEAAERQDKHGRSPDPRYLSATSRMGWKQVLLESEVKVDRKDRRHRGRHREGLNLRRRACVREASSSWKSKRWRSSGNWEASGYIYADSRQHIERGDGLKQLSTLCKYSLIHEIDLCCSGERDQGY